MATLATRHSPFPVGRAESPVLLQEPAGDPAYLYVAPAMALFFLLMVFPMAMVFRYSLLDRAILSPDPAFVWPPRISGKSSPIRSFGNR